MNIGVSNKINRVQLLSWETVGLNTVRTLACFRVIPISLLAIRFWSYRRRVSDGVCEQGATQNEEGGGRGKLD